MRLPCPLCGERDIREFGYTGAAVLLDRPAPDAGGAAWDDYLHLRKNPAGLHDELWYHFAGCAAWLVVTRDTVTHAVSGARLAADRGDVDQKDDAAAEGSGAETDPEAPRPETPDAEPVAPGSGDGGAA